MVHKLAPGKKTAECTRGGFMILPFMVLPFSAGKYEAGQNDRGQNDEESRAISA
jgi:hypothetical protein